MGRKDWYYIHLPKLLIKRLDQFLQTPKAKGMGMSSKSELLRHVLNQFLEEQESSTTSWTMLVILFWK
jgi:metal-responsive CopG/Arc/MetJ family transcriptional regulator